MALAAISEKLGIPHNFQQLNIVLMQLEKNEKIYELYKIKFYEITKLKEGDKLARDNSGVYYRHEKGEYFVQLRRWWENQGRKQTFNHLDEDFTGFMKYLDNFLGNLGLSNDPRYEKLGNKLKELANLLMSGLYSLKSTYPEEKELICKVDSIILSLIDFKTSLVEKLKFNSTNFKGLRLRALSE